jgi:hypothetical protein
MFLNEQSVLKLNCQSTIIEIMCNNPKFTVTIKGDENHADKIQDAGNEYISFKPYAHVIKAIKDMKQLSNELATPMHVEFGTHLWTVSVSQCCIFGSAQGIAGMISSQLFEKIYDWDAMIAQTSKTSLTIKREFDAYYYIIRVPVQSTGVLPKYIPKMTKDCGSPRFESTITNDAGPVIRELAKTVKKEHVQAMFSPDRFDVLYDNEQMHLSTIPNGVDVNKYISVLIPSKTLTPIINMLGESTRISMNGDVVCLMQDKKGLLVSGIVSSNL